MKTNI